MTKEKNRGITLIALVVTIVILLILSGIAISELTTENGLLNKVKEAKNKSNYEQIKEELNLILLEAAIVKNTEEDYNQESYLNRFILDRLREDRTSRIIEDTVYINEFQFSLNRDVPCIGDGNAEMNEEGIYYRTINAGTTAKWVELVTSGVDIPEGATINYSFFTSNDRVNWSEEIQDLKDCERSQFIKVKIQLISNDEGEAPSVSSVMVRFLVSEQESISIELDGMVFIEFEDMYQLSENASTGTITQVVDMKEVVDIEDVNVPISVDSGKTSTSDIDSVEGVSSKIYVSNDSVNWSEYIPGSTTKGRYVKTVTTVTNGGVMIGATRVNSKTNSGTPETGWITAKTEYYILDAGEVGSWIDYITKEKLPEGTRLAYQFSKSNDYQTWTNYSTEITDNGDSSILKVKILYQVKDVNITQLPVLEDIEIEFLYNNTTKKYTLNNMTKDTMAPVINPLTVYDEYINMKATDSESGIIGYNFTQEKVAPKTWKRTNKVSTSINMDFNEEKLGFTGTIFAWVIDEAGNVSQPYEFEFYITKLPSSDLEVGQVIWYPTLANSYTATSTGSSNQTFSTTNGLVKMVVLRKGEGLLEIIPETSIGNISFYGTNGYNYGPTELNNIAKIYENTAYSTSTYSINSAHPSSMYNLYQRGFTKIYGTNNYVWLATQSYGKHTTSYHHGGMMVAVTTSSGAIGTGKGNYGCGATCTYSTKGTKFTRTHGIVPVVSLRTDLKIIDGAGTSASPFRMR